MTTQDSISSAEIKVGLMVIALLVVALSWAVARRFLQSEIAPAAAVSATGYHLATPSAAQKPLGPRPMVLPMRERYTGSASHNGSHLLESRDTATRNNRLLNHPPSLLPALPVDDRIRNVPVEDEFRRQGAVGEMTNDECRMSNVEGPASHAVVVCDGDREIENDHPVATASALAPPWAKTNLLDTASPTVAVSEHSPSLRLVIQKPEILPVDYSKLQPGRLYTAKQHDTWRTIARSALGDAERWPEIYYLNHAQIGQLSDALPTGVRIVLPTCAKH